MPRVAQHDEQPLKEAECAEVVDLALEPGGALDGGGDVGLCADPRQDAIGLHRVTRRESSPVSTQCRREQRRASTHLGEPALHEVVDPLLQGGRVVL